MGESIEVPFLTHSVYSRSVHVRYVPARAGMLHGNKESWTFVAQTVFCFSRINCIQPGKFLGLCVCILSSLQTFRGFNSETLYVVMDLCLGPMLSCSCGHARTCPTLCPILRSAITPLEFCKTSRMGLGMPSCGAYKSCTAKLEYCSQTVYVYIYE
jgi:hypothetical protein